MFFHDRLKFFIDKIFICVIENDLKNCVDFLEFLISQVEDVSYINLAWAIYNSLVFKKKNIDFDKSIKFFEQLNKVSGNKEIKAIAYFIIASIYHYDKPDLMKAAKFYFKSFLLSQKKYIKFDCILEEIKCLKKLADYFETTGKKSLVERVIYKILRKLNLIKELSDNKKIIYKSYAEIAFFLAKLKKFDLAIFCLNEFQTNDPEILGVDFYNRGLIYSMMGAYENAIQNFLYALEFKIALNLEIDILFELGESYEALKDHKNAVIYFEKCLKILDNNNEDLKNACYDKIEYNKKMLENYNG